MQQKRFNGSQKEEIMKRLKKRLAEVTSERRTHRTTLMEQYSTAPDFVDRAWIGMQKSEAATKVDGAALKVTHVHAAIGRLVAGTYGECAECGHEISDKRLEAVPEAELCITCQERAEGEQFAQRVITLLQEPAHQKTAHIHFGRA